MLHPFIINIINMSKIEMEFSQVLLAFHALHQACEMVPIESLILIQVQSHLRKFLELGNDITERSKMSFAAILHIEMGGLMRVRTFHTGHILRQGVSIFQVHMIHDPHIKEVLMEVHVIFTKSRRVLEVCPSLLIEFIHALF